MIRKSAAQNAASYTLAGAWKQAHGYGDVEQGSSQQSVASSSVAGDIPAAVSAPMSDIPPLSGSFGTPIDSAGLITSGYHHMIDSRVGHTHQQHVSRWQATLTPPPRRHRPASSSWPSKPELHDSPSRDKGEEAALSSSSIGIKQSTNSSVEFGKPLQSALAVVGSDSSVAKASSAAKLRTVSSTGNLSSKDSPSMEGSQPQRPRSGLSKYSSGPVAAAVDHTGEGAAAAAAGGYLPPKSSRLAKHSASLPPLVLATDKRPSSPFAVGSDTDSVASMHGGSSGAHQTGAGPGSDGMSLKDEAADSKTVAQVSWEVFCGEWFVWPTQAPKCMTQFAQCKTCSGNRQTVAAMCGCCVVKCIMHN